MIACEIWVGNGPCGEPAVVWIDDIRYVERTPVCARHNDAIRAPRDWQWEADEYERLAIRLDEAGDKGAAAYWRRRAKSAREEGRRGHEEHRSDETGEVPAL